MNPSKKDLEAGGKNPTNCYFSGKFCSETLNTETKNKGEGKKKKSKSRHLPNSNYLGAL